MDFDVVSMNLAKYGRIVWLDMHWKDPVESRTERRLRESVGNLQSLHNQELSITLNVE